MTRSEILNLDGRSLDYAIAPLMGDTIDGDWWLSQDGSKIKCEDGGPRKYSEDMNAAWMVAERFKLTITPKSDATQKSRWLADIVRRGGGEVWLSYGPTAAVAICRAALMIVAVCCGEGDDDYAASYAELLRKAGRESGLLAIESDQPTIVEPKP